ncbi:MAG: 4-deoxy-4-formamido-L-arabinose-phosphoundecaprenol deformylase [Synergistaceae bacterium]|jgi:peptidoglycan/xylan/chitin deacetylase (PgdA/CDA1 family)|nr:4-deoxy-4-formamido-L-arabinose-phosphoundecaprenol deformylase [Synergistaceae bacterium]
MSCEVAIKIDVDTLKGYLEGVPRLLDILKERGIKASIFFSMGPDNSGKAVRRIFRKGFISKMLRTKAPSTYGWKTLFYGTLLKAPMIVSSDPGILRRAVEEGHDCGIHCWDHVLWQDRLPEMSREEIRAELNKAAELFSRVTGTAPKSSAAPGWQASFDSLTVQDELGFDYCSDVRGTRPFFPRLDGAVFRTLQIPSTLPTLDELWGTDGMDADNIHDKYLDLLEPGLNVHTLHAEMEGGAMRDVLKRFLDCCLEGEVVFPTLKDVASWFKHSPGADIADVEMCELSGRAGKVAFMRSPVPAAHPGSSCQKRVCRR